MLPGDALPASLHENDHTLQLSASKLPTWDSSNVIYGGGSGELRAARAAVLTEDPLRPSKHSLRAFGHQYTPKLGDVVLGEVLSRNAEGYKLDINTPYDAFLPLLAFSHATKRNCPRFTVGSRVLCQVSSSVRHYEAEVSCVSALDVKGWTSGENYLGQLNGGYTVDVSLAEAACLASEQCYLLERLGKQFPFEVAVGLNGRVWISAATSALTAVVAVAINHCLTMDLAETEVFVRQILQRSDGG